MNITGTKKLLIIAFALLCALAAGLGMIFTSASRAASAETASSAVAEEEPKDAKTAGELSAELSDAYEQAKDGYPASEEDGQPEADEGEYDERYDEVAIRQIAELAGMEYDFVNFYVHIKNLSAPEFYEQLRAEREEELSHADGHDHCEGVCEHVGIRVVSPDEASSYNYGEQLPEEEYKETLFSVMAQFRDGYAEGTVTVDGDLEDRDWFVSPDEVSTFAYYNYAAQSHLTISGATSATSWATYSNGASNSWSRGAIGARATVTAPVGTKITLTISLQSINYNFISFDKNDHWSSSSVYYDSNHDTVGLKSTNYHIIDGDAPTGTEFCVYKYYCVGCSCSGYSHYYSLGTNATNSCKYFEYRVTVNRSNNPTVMTINNSDNTGTLSTTSRTNDTIEKTYLGSPVRLTLGPDLGVGLVTWSASSPNVTLYSRSVHAESTSNIILECSIAGTYTITLTSFSGKWSDGTSGPLTFYFTVKSQSTERPTMVQEEGVAANGQTKVVNDTGGRQTVSFEHCDKRYVSYTSTGLLEASWTNDGVLTLYQNQQGTYTITLFLTNSAGCTWTGGGTEKFNFTFKISEMLINKPTIKNTEGVSGNTLTVDYNKGDQYMTLGPAIEGQLMIIIGNLAYTFNSKNSTVQIKASEAAKYEIRIQPSSGYIWSDKTSTSLTFFFIVNPLLINVPELDEVPAEGVTLTANRKTVTYNPVPGSYHTLTIKNYDKEGLARTTALAEHSFTPYAGGNGEGTLVLKASNAGNYSVILICNKNYVFNTGTTAASVSFYLQIDRYILGTPKILYGEDEKDNIEGATKTLRYEDVRDNRNLGFVKVFVGATNATQISIEVSPSTNPSNNLTYTWNSEERSVTFKGTEADQYVIKLTPTANYQWSKGDFIIRFFQFVITPIYENSLPIYFLNEFNAWSGSDSGGWDTVYNGEMRYIAVGTDPGKATSSSINDENAYKPAEMDYEIQVDSGLELVEIKNGYIMCRAKDSGTYTVTVKLKNSNHAWLMGGGLNLDYRFIIYPRAIAAPKLERAACSGNGVLMENITDTSMAGIYNGEFFSMYIMVDVAENLSLDGIIAVTFDEPEEIIWKSKWSNATEYSRIVVHSIVAGSHWVHLEITDDNFSWQDENYIIYDFELYIERAIIDGVDFSFLGGTVGATEEFVGSNNGYAYAADYVTNKDQYLILRLSDNEQNKNHSGTPYSDMIEYAIFDGTGNDLGMDAASFRGTESIRVAVQNAGTYLINVTPTINYMWGGDDGEEPFTFMLTINPKWVNIPALYDNGGIDTDDNTSRSVGYTGKNQQLIIDLGDDWQAYAVESCSYGMQLDTSVSNNKQFVYYAVNRGQYDLNIKLASENYMWDANETYSFHLKIERAGVDLPTVYLVEAQNWSDDALNKGTRITFDSVNEERVYYKNSQYFVYLLGQVVVGRDVKVEVSPETDNYENIISNLYYDYVQDSSGNTKAYEIRLKSVNLYTITVGFEPFKKDEYGNLDYNFYWNNEDSVDQDCGEHTVKVEILKRLVDLPTIRGDESAAMVDNTFSKYVTFDRQHHDITLQGYLAMSSNFDTGRLKIDERNTDREKGIITFTTDIGSGGSTYASVANNYTITVRIDEKNERWNVELEDPLAEDSTPKYYRLVIEKLAISTPKVIEDITGDPEVIYDEYSKSVIYSGERWNNAFWVENIQSTYMGYTLASSATMQGQYNEVDGIGKLVVSTAANSNSYDVFFALKDTANMKWDTDDDSSADLTYSFVVLPKVFDKVSLVDDGDETAVFDANSKTVIYNYNLQYFSIDNLVLDSGNRFMSVTIISGTFADIQTQGPAGIYYSRTYAAKNAGKYTVRVSLTKNASWGDGEPRYIDFSLIIEKLQFETPFIVDDGMDEDAVIDGFTKTTSYELDSHYNPVVKTVYFDNYNSAIMKLSNLSVTVNEGKSRVEDYDEDFSWGYYYVSAKYAGTYSITFRMLDFLNTRWKYADKETITFTFRINKKELANPLIEGGYLISGEMSDGYTLKSIYDGRTHTVLLNNIYIRNNNAETGEPYMHYQVDWKTTSQDFTQQEYLATTGTLTAEDIFGTSHTGLYQDTNLDPKDAVNMQDVLKFKATQPGTYTATVKLVDKDNMCWKGVDKDTQTYTLSVTKFEHDAPTVKSGTLQSQQYTGDFIEFYIDNAYNGVDTAGGPIVSFEYEKASLNPPVTNEPNAPWEISSWYSGHMVLRAKEVGTYSVTITIANTTTTSWTNSTVTSKNIIFTITKRTIAAKISYASSDTTVDASSGSWSISTPVTATITLTGICERAETGKVDDNVRARIYTYNTRTPKTQMNPVTVDSWVAVKQADGTYNLSCTYDIPYGEDNVVKGTYCVAVEQYLGGNYILPTTPFTFVIGADPAPFKTSMLVWQYMIDNDESTLVTISDWYNYRSNATAYPLDFRTDGKKYTFRVYMNDTGMAGFDEAGYTSFEEALLTWEVRFSSYGGTLSANYADTYWASARIVAKDSTLYAFADYVSTFYYSIKAIKYDLSGLVWDYDPATPYIYNGSPQSVHLTGTLPSGLTVQNYRAPGYDLNTQIYAGSYITSVVFTSTNKNYTPINLNDPSTYINDGTFVPTCSWQIKPADLSVEWMTVQDDTGSGTALVYVPVLKTHAEKVNYIYEKLINGVWEEITSFAHTGEEQFRVTAVLKDSPVPVTSPAYSGEIDYARNYVLRFVMESDPTVHTKEFTLGGNGSLIGVYVMVGGTSLSPTEPLNKYPFTGTPYDASIVVFYDPTSLITPANINITYYSSVNFNKPLSGAPTDPGTYRVKLTLKNVNFGDGTEYELGTTQIDYIIEKGTFAPGDAVWTYTHTDLSNVTVTAEWDTVQKKWIDGSGQEVTFVYDGAAHNVTLKSKNPALVITMKNSSHINAGKYTSKATFSFSSTRWNDPAFDTEFNWIIEKAVIDLSAIKWDYPDDYVYTVSGGKEKTFSVEIDGFSSLLNGNVSYKTYNELGDEIDNAVSKAGTYKTTCTVADLPEDSNYTVGKWPDTVQKTLTWTIGQRKLTTPASSGNWTVFDGYQHNLATALAFDSDWSEYYTFSIKYSSDGTNPKAYDGKKDYGYIYTAYNSGYYYYTVSIKSALNKDNTNVVWLDDTMATTTADQTVTLHVEKAAIRVDGWTENGELSKASLSSSSLPASYVLTRFVDYNFYEGIGTGGKKVTLKDVVNTDIAKTFSISAYLKTEYNGNIVLTFATGVPDYIAFTTEDISQISDDDQIAVAGDLKIKAYKVGGVTYEFSEEILAEDHVYVIYSGGDVTFVVDMWETYYVNYLDVWGGDDLTQNAAGLYNITFTLKKDSVHPLYWTKTGDAENGFVYDRSPVTLTFEIRYKMLDAPSFDKNSKWKLEEPTYTGSEIDILKYSLGDDYDKFIDEYGDFIKITGNTGTDAGSYTMNLTIKEEFSNTIRWNNGTQFGQQGTYSVIWKINPVYLIIPAISPSLSIYYDGNEHSVFEVLNGYSENGLSDDLNAVLQHAKVSSEGSRAINAGSYTAILNLPDRNFAWMDVAGNISKETAVVIENWKILPKPLDMSGVYWGFEDDNGKIIKYTESSPYVFTIENGNIKKFTMSLMGIPDELKPYITYLTDGEDGNTKSAVGSYATTVRIYELGSDESGNYTLIDIPTDFYLKYFSTDASLEIKWLITQRSFTIPANKVLLFDNTIHDLLKELGIAEGWENYFDVSVEYSKDGDEAFAAYEGDERVGYSSYNAFYIGYYRLTVSFKTEINADSVNVYWARGNEKVTAAQVVTVQYNPIEINVTGWHEDLEESTVISEELDKVKGTAAANMFEYVIYDYDTGDEVSKDDVSIRGSGYTYLIEFRIKEDIDYASVGIKLTFAEGVDNPYRFGNYNFGKNQPVIWVALPELEEDSQDFSGKNLEFKIKNWEEYVITDEFRTQFNNKYSTEGFTIGDEVTSFIYALDGSLDTKNGTFTAYKADNYGAKIRFTPNVNLSWYDSQYYEVIGGELYSKSTNTAVSKAEQEKLITRYSQNISYTVNFKLVDIINLSSFEVNVPQIIYDGTTKNIMVEGDYKAYFLWLKEQYGDLIVFEGDLSGTQAKDYVLKIALADEDSCAWNLNSYETVTIQTNDYKLSYFNIGGRWQIRFVAVDEDGEIILDNDGNFIEYDETYTPTVKYKYSYKVRYVLAGEGDDALLNEDGTPKKLYDAADNEIVRHYVLNEDGTAVRYDATHRVAEDGLYIAYYEVDADGNFILNEQPDMVNGHWVIDEENSYVTVTRLKTSTSPLDFKWKITPSSLVAPYVKAGVTLTYTSRELSITDFGEDLVGYNPDIMQIIDGGTATNAGEYSAKVVISSGNHFWRSANGADSEYVIVLWTIEKASIDLTGAKWNYTEDTVYEYTIKNGKAKKYSVAIELPDELKIYKDLIVYTTNGLKGSNAGRDAGAYETSFVLDYDPNNFDEVILPDTLPASIKWYINKRVLRLPVLTKTQIVFDDSVHDLMSFVMLPDDWNEYFDLKIQLMHGSVPIDYAGYDKDGVNGIDESEKYLIHGVGIYRFCFTIKQWINSSVTNPNVVWYLSDKPVTPPDEGGENEGGNLQEPVALFMILPGPSAGAVEVNAGQPTVTVYVGNGSAPASKGRTVYAGSGTAVYEEQTEAAAPVNGTVVSEAYSTVTVCVNNGAQTPHGSASTVNVSEYFLPCAIDNKRYNVREYLPLRKINKKNRIFYRVPVYGGEKRTTAF